ncbi:hypothetical protein IFM89_018241 [Coptis chinensis]|uniref:Protein EMBRYONIC FLOWER 1 n=1 Tax=Coptis chinensis TaxID=261450 RepID=A0A835M8A8_9MAGN|nr:hypothetical protein IFM89_018241 [Coptis chinensis]
MELVSTQPEVEYCGHYFSIRGYVASMRKKDRNTCWPFSFEEQVEVLPPLRVPDATVGVNEVENNITLSVDIQEKEAEVMDIVREDVYLSTDVVVAAEKNKGCEDGEAGNANKDTFPSDGHDTGTTNKAKEPCLPGVANEAGDKKSLKISPKSMCAHGKRKCINDTPAEFPRKKHLGSCGNSLANTKKQIMWGASNSEAHEVVNVDFCKNDTQNALTGETSKVHTEELEESDNEIFENSNASRNSQKKRQRKVRMLNDILKSAPPALSGQSYGFKEDSNINITEVEAEQSSDGSDIQSSDGSDVSLGIDLNLSPTRQVAKKKKNVTPDEDDSLQMSFQKAIPENLVNAAAADQQATSHKKKGKMPQCVDVESALMPLQGYHCLSRVQTRDENVPVQCTGPELVSLAPTKDASIGRGLPSAIKTYMERQHNGGELIENNNTFVNSQSEVPHRWERVSTPQLESGASALQDQPQASSGARHCQNLPIVRMTDILKQQCDQRTAETSQQAASDHNLMEMEDVEQTANILHEMRLRGSGSRNCLSGTVNNRLMEANPMSYSEIKESGLLQEKTSQKHKTKDSKEGSSSATAKRVASTKQMQSNRYGSLSSGHNRIHSLPVRSPELAQTSRGFTPFLQSKDNPSSGAHSLTGSSNRSFGNQNSTFLMNQERPSRESQFLLSSSRRNFGNQNSTFLMNREKLSGGDQVLIASRNCNNQNSTFSENQGKPPTAAQFHVGSSSRNFGNPNSIFPQNMEKPSSAAQLLIDSSRRYCGNQNPTFSQNHEKQSSGPQFLLDNSRICVDQTSNWDGKSVAHRYSQSNLQTSEAYETFQNVSGQNSGRDDRRVWSRMIPNCFPFGTSTPQKFSAQSNTTNRPYQCLELFPKGSMNGNHSLKSMDSLANHLEMQKRNLELETSKRAHPEYPFACRDKEVQFNPLAVRPVDLYNKEPSATHLLRLMDAGFSPSTPINLEDSQRFGKQPFLARDNHQQDMRRFGYSKNKEGLMLPPPPRCSSRNPHPVKFTGNFPSSSDVNAVGSSIPKNDFFQRKHGSRVDPLAKSLPTSPRAHLNGNAKMKEAPIQTNTLRSNKSVSGSSTSGKNLELVPRNHLPKGFLSTPDRMPFPTNSLPIKDPIKHVAMVNKVGTASLGTSTRRREFCSMNRNPADFTVPEAGNEYMIGYGDLKPKENVLSRDRTGLVEPVGNKRQKMVKLTAIKDI